jgi:hypothetical protein
MSVKLLMHWNIKPGRDQDYFEFVVREWGPGISKLGIELSGLWYTAYSADTSRPQIMAEAIAEDLSTMHRILDSAEWKSLHAKLLDNVSGYAQKVVRVTGDFQL